MLSSFGFPNIQGVMAMRDDQTRDDTITEIGDATALTKGERLEQSIEALTVPDKYDVG